MTFGAWWKLVDNDDIVEVQFPHKRHGSAGKESNHAKKQAMADFLEFVDINSQPNGLVAIVPNFFSFRSSLELRHLKWEKKVYEEQLQSFVVSQFNKAQTEKGRQTCHNTAATNWLQKYRPKVALHPSMTDYCDTCKHLKQQLSQNQAVLNRLQQSSRVAPLKVSLGPMSPPNGSCKRNWQITRQLQHDLESTIYKATIDKCREQWAKIEQLTKMQVLTRREREDLEGAKYGFTATISADYQQSKLIPSWGKTEQPGSTYYLQKVSHDVFGVVDHSKNNSVVYLFNERVGPKYTDHTLSFLTHYWNRLRQHHPWIHRLAIFLDNATCTNKKY